MMTMGMLIIAVCSIVGPMGLCLGVMTRYPSMRLLFAIMACTCTALMWFLFGTYFGETILKEIYYRSY